MVRIWAQQQFEATPMLWRRQYIKKKETERRRKKKKQPGTHRVEETKNQCSIWTRQRICGASLSLTFQTNESESGLSSSGSPVINWRRASVVTIHGGWASTRCGDPARRTVDSGSGVMVAKPGDALTNLRRSCSARSGSSDEEYRCSKWMNSVSEENY